MIGDGDAPKFWMPPRPAIIRVAPDIVVPASFIPGWFPAGVVADGKPKAFPEVAATNTSMSTSATQPVALPSGITAGDLLIIMMAVTSQGGP